MTGYGRAEETTNQVAYVVEIRSLNSKFLDLKLKLPAALRVHEMDLRRHLSDEVKRGKIEVAISLIIY